MICYECAKSGGDVAATAICGCGAGLCLEHLREAAASRRSAPAMAGCPHDTWTPRASVQTVTGRWTRREGSSLRELIPSLR